MAGIDIPGDSVDWIDNVKIHTLDSIVEGNDSITPDIDGDANLPLRALTNRTARIKAMLDTFGIFLKVSEFTHSGQNVIYNAPIRGDVLNNDLVSFNTNQYWRLDLTQSDSRNIVVGIADITNSRIITGGLITITGFGDLGFTEGDPIYANPTSPGEVQTAWSPVRIGQYLFNDIIRLSLGDELDAIPRGSITSMLFNQAAAPVGWTTKTDWANAATLLVGNSYMGGGIHSPTSFTTNIGINNHLDHMHNITVNDHVLTIDEIPPHNHPYVPKVDLASVSPDKPTVAPGNPGSDVFTNNTGGGEGHDHTATSSYTSLSAHDITQSTYSPRYQIMIACTRD